jgi:hypothetical protein
MIIEDACQCSSAMLITMLDSRLDSRWRLSSLLSEEAGKNIMCAIVIVGEVAYKVVESQWRSPTSMSIPFPQYASTLGVHTSLLLFTAFFLPRTTLLYYASPSQFPFAQSASSRDRPQLSFFEPLTASPILTLCWICGGVCILVVWWARWIRSWAYDQRVSASKKTDFEAKTEQLKWQSRGVSVSYVSSNSSGLATFNLM